MTKKKKKSSEKNYTHLLKVHATAQANSSKTDTIPTLTTRSMSSSSSEAVVTTQALTAEAYLKHDLFKLAGFVGLLGIAYAGIYYVVHLTTYGQALFK